MIKKNIDIKFDEPPQKESRREEATAVAIKRVIVCQIAQAMKVQSLTKTRLTLRKSIS